MGLREKSPVNQSCDIGNQRKTSAFLIQELSALVILTCHGCPPTAESLQRVLPEKNPESKTVVLRSTSTAGIPHFSPVCEREHLCVRESTCVCERAPVCEREHLCVWARTRSTSGQDSLDQDSTFRFSWPHTDVLISPSSRLSLFFSQDTPKAVPQLPPVD